MTTPLSSQTGLVVFAFALFAASLPACGGGGASLSDESTTDPGGEPITSAPPNANDPSGSNNGGPSEGGPVEPPPPPCDDAQTAAILASFTDVAKIPADIGAVAMVKDPSCGKRYFARGASKDVPETALHLVGSVTKTYVASLTLLLADEGKLSLSDSVTKWVSDVPGGDAVKVEHLLNHTSGIYNYTNDIGFQAGMALGLRIKYTPRSLLNMAFTKAPSFAPGTAGKWEYSNTGYVLLGMIIESVTGKTVAEAIRERILTPLGAKSTFFYGAETPQGEFAFGRTFTAAHGAYLMDPSAYWACGNYVSTIGDLVDWEEKRGNGTFHSPAMQAQMLKGIAAGTDFTYGAAIVVVGKTDTHLSGNGPAMGHGGTIPGYHTMGYYFPEKKATIAVIVHTDKGPNGSGFPFGATWLDGVLASVVDPYFGTTPK